MSRSGIVWAVIIAFLYMVTGLVVVFYSDFIMANLKTIAFIIVSVLGLLIAMLSLSLMCLMMIRR